LSSDRIDGVASEVSAGCHAFVAWRGMRQKRHAKFMAENDGFHFSAMHILCIVAELAIKPVFDITFFVSLSSRAPHNTTIVAQKPN